MTQPGLTGPQIMCNLIQCQRDLVYEVTRTKFNTLQLNTPKQTADPQL